MTEQDKKELIKMGFEEDDDGWLLCTLKEFFTIGIDPIEDIYFIYGEAEMFLNEFESIPQIRRKIEGLKMLVS